MIETQTKEKVKIKKQEIDRCWFIVDARKKILGRMSAKIATVLMGKHKPTWQPNIDMGDNVVVINAAKVAVTGKKDTKKIYYSYSGYPGGLKKELLQKLRFRKPEEVIRRAVAGMLPKNRLGAAMIKKLFIYSKDEHPHQAQQPEELEV